MGAQLLLHRAATHPNSASNRARWTRVAWSLLAVSAMLAIAAPPAAADSSSSSGCTGATSVAAPSNLTGGGSTGLCAGTQPLVTTSSWNTPWSTTDANVAPCNGIANSFTSSESGGALLAKESIEAISSATCLSNTANVTLNLGTHGATFQAWKAGSQYYTVVANFTFNDFLNPGMYCASGGSPSARATIQASTAMYDQSTGAGVGWSTNGGNHVDVIAATCNVGQPSQEVSVAEQASFTTSTTINQGDYLEPRGSVTATVWVSMPYAGGSAHVYSNVDFDNDGYGDITLNSIWVY